MKLLHRSPGLGLLASSTFALATLLACSSDSDVPGLLFDGDESPSEAGFSSAGDATLVLENKNDETGNTAVSVSGQGAEAPVVKLSVSGKGAANSIGVRFRVRGSDAVKFFVGLPGTTPTAEGGSCVDACGDYHHIQLAVTTEWTTVTLTWDQLMQSGTGAVVGLNPADLLTLNWQILSADAYNVWLDDVQFLYEPDGTTTPGTGGTTSTGGTTATGGTDPGTGGASSTGGSASGGSSTGGSTSTNALGKYVDSIMFQQAFPNRNAAYTYSKLLEAVEYFPDFASCCSENDKKREVAAFLAHVTHESGGLRYTDEIDGSTHDYCNTDLYSCPAGEYQYWGRGSLQITWNYNYKFATDYFASVGVSQNIHNSPGLVTSDGLLLWLTGLWFWMEGDPSYVNDAPHFRINTQGFGSTIQKINGGLECGGVRPDAVAARVQYYQEWCERLGVDPGSNLSC